MTDLLGVDIGSCAIKVVGLEEEKGRHGLTVIGETKMPTVKWLPNNGEDDKSKEIKNGRSQILVSLKSLLKDLKVKTKKAVSCLPEDKVVSRLVNLPSLKESEIKDALTFEAETFVPYPLSEVSIDYEVISEDSAGRLTVFVIAARNDLISSFVAMFRSVGLELVALESPAVALRRAVKQSMKLSAGVMVLDIGEAYSNMIGLSNSNLYFTRSLPMGGESMTRAVSLNLGLDMASAEEYKKAYGMREDQLEGKLRAAIGPIFTSLTDEIRKAIRLFSEDQNQNVNLLILSGGGANMPGLAEELTKVLGVEVQVVQPFLNIDTSKVVSPIDLSVEGCRFGLATGLALRSG